ncbi:hypothetical protein F383_35207 [Gossypium arboreum]|uniref:Uncharacterized protein n=1 Tax=Gossypium arboreum TaxID=29729 RepID=A0A0B0N1E4_GOSAR|nr:hypothetical protein F383_35207 [Gossypium arboreum]
MHRSRRVMGPGITAPMVVTIGVPVIPALEPFICGA